MMIRSVPQGSVTGRPWGFGFAVASFVFFPVWNDIFTQRGTAFDSEFVSNHHQQPLLWSMDFAAGLLLMATTALLIGAVLGRVYRSSPAMGHRVERLLALGLLLFALNVVRVYFLPWASFAAIKQAFGLHAPLAVGLTCLLAGSLILIWRFVTPRLVGLVFIGVPIGAVIVINGLAATWLLAPQSVYVDPPQLASAGNWTDPKRRVVWIILDEWDYRLTYEDRPAGLHLPTFDRLAATAFFATRATPPGWATLQSMPGLISGKITGPATYTEAGLVVQLTDPPEVKLLRALPSVFSAVHDRKIKTMALAQQYLPYCREYHQHIAQCVEMDEYFPTSPATPLVRLWPILRDVMTYFPVMNRLVNKARFDPGEFHTSFANKVAAALPSAGAGFAFIHWMVPHEPYTYDRRNAKYVDPTPGLFGYLDNLALADRLIGDALDSIDGSPFAAQTAVIISSDHAWRQAKAFDGKRDARVPFIVRLPDAGIGKRFDQPFNTVVTRDLIEALLDGRLATYKDISQFIHRPRLGDKN